MTGTDKVFAQLGAKPAISLTEFDTKHRESRPIDRQVVEWWEVMHTDFAVRRGRAIYLRELLWVDFALIDGREDEHGAPFVNDWLMFDAVNNGEHSSGRFSGWRALCPNFYGSKFDSEIDAVSAALNEIAARIQRKSDEVAELHARELRTIARMSELLRVKS